MSEVAQRARSQRQLWAAPGGRHDLLVAVARVALPVSVGVLAAFLVMAPLTASGDVSFVLDKNKVEVAHERLKIQAAQYRGQDSKGQPFTLQAGSAVQKSSAEPVVRISELAARITLTDGPAEIRADTGRYDMDRQQVAIDGPVNVTGPQNLVLRTRDTTVDLQARTLQSGGAVTGSARQGSFRADRLHADLERRTVTLDGHAHLRLEPGRAR